MPTERVTFPGHGGHELAARLDLPSGPHLATALFAHCFTCSKDIAAARRIAGRLTADGIAVLRFDFTGLGHSEGEFQNTTFTTNVQDLLAAAKALDARGMAPGLIIGHSLGGAAVLMAAGQIASARAVVTIGTPFDPAHVTENFGGALERIEREGSAKLSLGGRDFTIDRSFLEDIRAAELNTAIAKLKRALLVLHAPLDEVVGLDNATRIFTAAKHPKSFVTLDTADHLITDPATRNMPRRSLQAGRGAIWTSRLRRPRPRRPRVSSGSARPTPKASSRMSSPARAITFWRTSPKAMAAPIAV